MLERPTKRPRTSTCITARTAVAPIENIEIYPTHNETATNENAFLYRMKKCKTSDQAQLILQQAYAQSVQTEDLASIILAAMRVFAKEQRADLAFQYYQQFKPHNEAMRTWAVTIVGKHNHQDALRLLENDAHRPPPSIATYHAALAACNQKKSSHYQDAWDIFHQISTSSMSSLTINTLLTCLAKAKQGAMALEILQRCMTSNHSIRLTVNDNINAVTEEKLSKENLYPSPDRNAFQQTIRALIRSSNHHPTYAVDAYHVWKQMQQEPYRIMPVADYTSMVQQALLRQGHEDLLTTMSHIVSSHRDTNPTSTTTTASHTLAPLVLHDFEQWDCPGLDKVVTQHGKKKRQKQVYWKCGELTFAHQTPAATNVTTLIVALQPNRHPARNGIKLLLYHGDKKVAYLLMINSHQSTSSSQQNTGRSKLLGFYLDPSLRGQGLAKVLCAVWLRLCLLAKVTPMTGYIHKPLIALVLQYTFGMEPKDGVEAELSLGDDGTVVLYSEAKDLAGAFTPLDQRTQNVVLSSTPASPRGRKVRIGGTFGVPMDKNTLADRVNTVLGLTSPRNDTTLTVQEPIFVCHVASDDMRRVLLGE